MIGGYALIFGILLVILGLRLRNWRVPEITVPLRSMREKDLKNSLDVEAVFSRVQQLHDATLLKPP
jgi:hypothetical protein